MLPSPVYNEFDGDNAHKNKLHLELLKAKQTTLRNTKAQSHSSGLNFFTRERFNVKDHGVALSNLGKQAPFVNLTLEREQRVLELIAEIKSIFNEQVEKAS